MDNKKHNIYAVCALILSPQDTSVFLGVSRKDNPNAMGLVGGKVDPGETPEEALIREVREETGLTVTAYKLIFCDFDGPKSVATYLCNVEGKIIQRENEGRVAWVTIEDLFNGPFAAYNKRLFAKLS